MTDAPNTASYILVSPDTLDLPNSRVLAGTAGSIALNDSGVGGPITITPIGILGNISSFASNGYLGFNNTTNTFQGLSFIDSSTISVTNPDGTGGTTTFSVIPNSSIQKVVVENGGVYVSTRSALNFIAGTNASVTVVDNGGLGTADIRIDVGGSEAPGDATYILKVDDAELPNAQALGDLASGILKSTTTTGVVSIAVSNTDYQAASAILTSISSITPATGELIVGNAGVFSGLAPGPAGTVLTSNGTGDSLRWDTPAGTGTVTSVGLTSSTIVISGAVSPITDSGTFNIDLPIINTITPGEYDYASVTADAQGRIIGISANTPATVTSVGVTSPNNTLTVGGTNPVMTSGNIEVDLAIIGTITPGVYTNPNITIDQYGRITAASNGVAGLFWNVVPSGGPVPLVTQNGYIAYQIGPVSFTTPATASVGDNYVMVASASIATPFTCAVNAGQTILYGAASGTTLTAPTAGSAYSLSLVCIDATVPGAEVFQALYNTGTLILT